MNVALTGKNAFRYAALTVVFGAITTLSACGLWDRGLTPVIDVPGGDVERGRDALRDYGCIACHSVPGVDDYGSYVGPPLDAWSQRRYIAGRVPNDLDNLIEWIQFPQAIDPETAMPSLAVSDEDARHIAAYLFSLE